MIVTGEVLWPMDMRLFISYCHDVILLAGCSFDDRDRGSVVAKNMSMLISYCHDVILSAGCSIDDRDSGSVLAHEYEYADQLLYCSIDDRDRGTVVANAYGIVDHLLLRFDSFGGLFD